VSVVSDSRAPGTIAGVRAALGGCSIYAVFIDGNRPRSALRVRHGEMLGPDGFSCSTTVVWEGSATHKDSADVLAEIDRLAGTGPAHRFMRTIGRDETWGVVEFTRK
jgi:hypothetical protein